MKNLFRKARNKFLELNEIAINKASNGNIKNYSQAIPVEYFFNRNLKNYYRSAGNQAYLDISSGVFYFYEKPIDYYFNLPASANSLIFNFKIFSYDYKENWIETGFFIESSIKRRNKQGLGFLIKSEGKGGVFRIIILDNNGGEWVYELRNPLKTKDLVYVFIPLKRFKLWKNTPKDKKLKLINGIKFQFSIDKTIKIPFEQKIILIPYFPEFKKYFHPLYDITEINEVTLSHYYWFDAGEDAYIGVYPNIITDDKAKGALKVKYGIKSNNSEKNWIVLRHHDFKESINIKDFEGIEFWIKSNGKGGFLRIDLEGEKGKISYKDDKVLNQSGWHHIKVKFNEFVGNNIENIKVFSIYIGLDWHKPPIEGEFILYDFSFSKYDVDVELKETSILKDFVINSIHERVVKEKYDSLFHRRYKELLNRERMVSFNGKLIKFSEYQRELSKKYKQGLSEKGFISFSEKDIIILKSKEENRWGLDKVALFVEPTNLCNLQCIMCNHGDHSFQRPLGVMKLKEFKKIVDEIVEERLNLWEFAPFWLGESFVHPQINEFLAYASNAKTKLGTFRYFNIHTNGVMLEKSHLDAILNSRLSSILFSIDAYKKGTYEKIRVGGDLDKVINNVRYLLSERKKRGQTYPKILVQLIAMDENVNEIRDFADFWMKEGMEDLIYAGRPQDNPFPKETKLHLLFPQVLKDSVFIKALEPNALTKNQTHREAIPEVKPDVIRKPCASLWRMMSVAWDGTATACCRDDQLQMPIGNVLKTSLKDVWYGDKLREQRLAHILGEFEKTPKCIDCVNWVKNPLSDDEVVDYLKSIGEEGLIDKYFKRIGKK